MEQYFYLHHLLASQNVTITSLYLEQDQFVWYHWICERKKDSIASPSIFTKKLIEHYGDIKSNTLFIRWVNLF